MDQTAQKNCPQCGKLASGNISNFSVDRHCLSCDLWWHKCHGGLKLGTSVACRLCNDDLAPFREPRPIPPTIPPSFVPRPPPSMFAPSAFAQVETCRNCGSMTCPGAVHGSVGFCTKKTGFFNEKRTGIVCDNCGYSVCRCADDDE